MSGKKRVRITALSVALLGLLQNGCMNRDKDNPSSEGLDKFELPIPNKIERRGSGFSPVGFSVKVDFTTGLVEYERYNDLIESDSCRGSLTLGDEVEAWKKAAQPLVCTGLVENPISDGFSNILRLQYPNGTALPGGLVTTKDTEGTNVEILEALNESVSGKQQFDCSGSFTIDADINDKIPCLQITP